MDASFGVSWSQRFISIDNGRNADLATGGYFDITMPANGTVISGYGSAANKTVTSGKIVLDSWTSLWYELPYGLGTTSQPGNFRLVHYGSDFVVPNNWIMIAIRNQDSAEVEWATGESVAANYNSDIYNIGGQKIKKFNLGYVTDTTNASGQCIYAHGLGMVPNQVITSKGASGGTSFIANVSGLTSTTFMVTYRRVTDGTIQGAGVVCDVVFLAYAE